MRNSRILNFSNYLLLALAFLFLPQSVFALGQTTKPIVVENAMRGEKIQQEMVVVNTDSSDLPVELTAEGDISDWTTFYLPENLNEPITETIIPADKNLKLIVIFSVPIDTAGNEYKGLIGVINMPPDKEENDGSLVYIRQKIDRKVTITVSDSGEIINIEKSSIIPNTYDLKIDKPLDIRVIYDSQGNVSIRPQLRLTIRKNEEIIHDVIYPYPENDEAVNSLSQHEIDPIVVQTIGWEEGRYLAELAFFHDNEIILEKGFNFSIVAEKEEAQSGVFTVGSIDKRLFLFIFAVFLIVIGFIVKKFIIK